MSSELKAIFEKLAAREDLTRAEARWVCERIMAGELAEATIGALLGAIAVKGESVDELVGAAEAMRAASVRVRCDADCIDTCGTGGDGISTFNVSTTAAIIAASAGAVVAKHGNRSTTRASGSTEVLTQLGIGTDAPVQIVERCLAEARIGYLNARLLHPAMKFAAPVRQAIPIRTIFNLLGPLTNPAGARRQVLGVPHVDLTEKIAAALLQLGAVHAWVVHGEGLCDLTATGRTSVVEVHGGRINRFTIEPESMGIKRSPLDALRIETPEQSAEAIRFVLNGGVGPRRDHALLNAAAALHVAGVAMDLGEGIALAAQAVDSRAARQTLELWRSMAPISKETRPTRELRS